MTGVAKLSAVTTTGREAHRSEEALRVPGRQVVARLLEDRPTGRDDDEVAHAVGGGEELHLPGEDVRLANAGRRIDHALERRLALVDVVPLRNLGGEALDRVGVWLAQVEPGSDLLDDVAEKPQLSHLLPVLAVLVILLDTQRSNEMERRFYTPAEAAAILNVSSTTVMNRIHAGELPAVRVSERIYRIPIPAFERFVSGRPTPEFEVEWRQVEKVRDITDPVRAPSNEALEV
jgi:excisionase family DNA binding protein